jgi:CRISPR-associated protein Csy2
MTNIKADTTQHWAILLIPRIRVQNANAISSPMTWGFPAITSFLGLMTNIERRLGEKSGIEFKGVGVVCHDFEAQITTEGFTRAFHLTRNPVGSDGSPAGIVEEGRVHLEMTLIFSVRIGSTHLGEAERHLLLSRVTQELSGMRLAGGSIMPALPGSRNRRSKPFLELEAEGDEAQQLQIRKLKRACLPGFVLVSRDDLLASRMDELLKLNPKASVLDAWLDLSRWNHHSVQSGEGETIWQTTPRQGWTVPIPVGYTALSKLHESGSVSGARDSNTPFRFVETIWSMGQWISPHRLNSLDDFFWYSRVEGEAQMSYRCCNDYKPAATTEITTA